MSDLYYNTSHGISAVVCYPVATGNPTPVETLAPDSIDGYSHRINAIGGYESADILIGVRSIAEAEMWFQNRLGSHIDVYGRSGQRIWEGFIDSISVNAVAASLTRGPLMDVANRISVMYTPIIDETADPIITGTETETTIQEDDISQSRYGILERVLSGGQMLDSEADIVRDVFLKENKDPKTTSGISLPTSGTSGGISLTLSCKGYFSWFERYVYNGGSTPPVSTTARAKLLAVIGADPNGIFSTDYGLIATNASLTTELEDKNRTADTIIKEILTLGDGSDTPFTFGVYDNRVCVYSEIPDVAEYYYYIFSDQQVMSSSARIPIEPYDVKPGKWALVPDFQFGGAIAGKTIFEDARSIYIESVDFSTPNSLNISGSPIFRLPQLLASMGLGSIS